MDRDTGPWGLAFSKILKMAILENCIHKFRKPLAIPNHKRLSPKPDTGPSEGYMGQPALSVVVSINRGPPIQTPNSFDPYHAGPQKGTPNFRKPPM